MTAELAALWLVRHGESDANLADRLANERGTSVIDLPARDADVELSETGRDQAEAVGRWARGLTDSERPTVVLCSPYARARRTAAPAAAALGLEVGIDERLRERDLGILDGLTGAGVRERFPEEAARRDWLGKFYYRPPGGESWCDVAMRMRSVLATLRQEHGGQRVMAVTHQAVITVMRYVLDALDEPTILQRDRSEQLPNGSITTYVRMGDGRLTLQRWAAVDHLAAEGTPATEEPDAEARVG